MNERRKTPAGSHECPASGCPRLLPMSRLACQEHLAMVSRPTRARLAGARNGGRLDELIAACTAAIREIDDAVARIRSEAPMEMAPGQD